MTAGARPGDPYELLGWPVSPYTAKVRAYLRFKGIPFFERRPSLIVLRRRVRRAVGAAIMPTVVAPDGTWMQDSSEIIDLLEGRHPRPSITPPGPRQRLASLLMELHGDEWLPMVALHYRWHRPANAAFAVDEFARYGLPGVPLFLARPVARRVARQMASYLPRLGVSGPVIVGLEAFTEQLLDRLDTHLREHPFLLGTRPCLGDFALYGPLWAHLCRDPATTSMVAARPALLAWIARLRDGFEGPGEFLADDQVPETLTPVLRTLFEEQFVHLEALVAAIDAWCDEHPDATRVPRSLGDTDVFSVGGAPGRRRLVTFSQWMLQRSVDEYAAVEGPECAGVDAWLASVGGQRLSQLAVRHPFERVDFQMQLVPRPREGQGAGRMDPAAG